MRYALIAAMTAAWLCVDYPYGLWLFLIGGAWPWALYRAHQVFGRKRNPDILQVGR